MIIKAVRIIKFIFTLLTVSILLGASTGVYALWNYANGAEPAETEQSVGMGVFEYKAEEILPGGSENSGPVEIGGNHNVLIDLILNEDDKGYGLNINNNVVLHKYLKRQPVVYSNQKVSGGNLKFILDVKHNTYGLYYCLEYISETEYYCYTFETDDLSTVGGSTTEMVAYRTILVKTDKWRATTSYKGYALTKRVSSMGASADSNSIIYSIDMSTWHM